MTDLCVVLVVQAAVSVPWVLPRDPGLEPASLSAYLLTTLTVVPLLWRRRAPVRVLLAVLATQSLYGLAVDGPGQTLPYTGLVALYSVAAHAPSPARRLCGALTLAIVFPSVAFNTGEARELVFSLMVFTAAYGFGRFTDTRQAYTRAVEDRARQLEVTRRIEAEQAAARERARIAREMHDILSHAVSLMIVQAEAGPVAVRTAPERAEAAFDAISETGRDAMVQLRRMLGVLREEGQGPGAPRSPQPALDGLPALVERVRSSGLAVTLTVTGPERPLPRDTDSAVYRIVQEALTNAVKHAAATEAAVLLAYGESSLTVSVTDDGVGTGPKTRSGHGLIGIRERAAAHGGSARTGPGPDGQGFGVDVTLPLVPVTSALEVGS
ncbi:sensor histidine kinase [Streptomyces sp. NPDC008163]|uniref:sensor histidine kinase n=1 Tax=Streptomyces sp. NPDC008163 TaxID=3364818 RepID=UPI0036F190FD